MMQAALENLVVDDRDAGLFRVHRSAYTDPHVLELEQRRLSSTWARSAPGVSPSW